MNAANFIKLSFSAHKRINSPENIPGILNEFAKVLKDENLNWFETFYLVSLKAQCRFILNLSGIVMVIILISAPGWQKFECY